MKKDEFYSLMKSVPKAEVHVHQEAVLGRETIKKVYQRSYNKKMSNQEFNSLFSYTDLPGFLDSFIKIQSFFTSIDDLDLLFQDFADYLEENNIDYCEAFFSPTSHLKKGWDFSQMISKVSAAIKRIKKEYGKTVKIIVDVSRSFGEANAMNNLNLILKEKNPDIIGIGLGGNEAKGPPEDYKKVFEKARKNELHVVAHAGEVCDSNSIKSALKNLKIERIGHGITAAFDDELMQELKESQIPFEVCPTSNLYTKNYVTDIKKHPVKKMYQAGLNITINTDDPTFFKVNLIDEYWNLYSKLDFTLDDIKQLVLNSYKACFISSSKKKNYCLQAEKAWNEWWESHPEIQYK